jgi:NAD(P)-dependent dehydrogenase (short-subunit alcohol dehydrogenase family)
MNSKSVQHSNKFRVTLIKEPSKISLKYSDFSQQINHNLTRASAMATNGTTSKLITLITGANQGLGYYSAQQLANTGKYHVLIGSRDFGKAQKAIEQLVSDESVKVTASDFEALQIDVTSDDSIYAAAKTVKDKHGKLDILMNNAGIATQQAPAADGKGPTLRELYHQHYDTNLFGAGVTTEAFLPLLKKSTASGGKRIAFTSSGLSSLQWALEDPGQMGGANYPLYRSTKTALNMIMIYYARTLENEGFVVSGSDPGYCGMTHDCLGNGSC